MPIARVATCARHLEPVCVRLGDRVEDAAVVERAARRLRDGDRQRSVRHLGHRPQRADLVVEVDEVGDDLQHAGAGLADRLRDADELFARGRERRCRVTGARAMVQRPRRREPERARRHGRGGDASHLGDLVGRRRLTVGTAITHHVEAHGAVRHLRGDVDVVRATADRVEVLGEALPVPLQALVQRRAGDVLDTFHQRDEPAVIGGVHRREPDAAVAHHDRRDAVPRRGREVVVPRRLAVVVGVDVDPSRRDQRAVRVDFAATGAVDRADRNDGAVLHRDIAGGRRRSGPVDDRATADDEVEVGHARRLLSGGPRGRPSGP